MEDTLFWLYLVNAVILIVHEIDSAYWKEWQMFRLPGGVTTFLLLHVPLTALVLYALCWSIGARPPGTPSPWRSAWPASSPFPSTPISPVRGAWSSGRPCPRRSSGPRSSSPWPS